MARLRSPNFPAIPLDEAVRAVATIYDKNRQAMILREDAAKDIGYTGLTGRSLQVLGALNQYDLVENVSKGYLRVTQTAVDILHGYPDEVKREALRKAGHSPSLFQDIFDRFEGQVPGDNAVRSFLIQNGFTNDGADKALKNFSGTNLYLEVNEGSGSYSNQPWVAAEADSRNEKGDDRVMQAQHPLTPEPSRQPQTTDSVVVSKHDGPLDFNLSSKGLVVTGKTNSALSLRAFIAKLEALAALLPNEEEVLSDEGAREPSSTS